MAASTTCLGLIQSVRSRRMTYVLSCAGSVVAAADSSLVLGLSGATALGAPNLLADFLAQAYEQYFIAAGSPATPAGYAAAQQQAAALFINSPLIQKLYNFASGVAVPTPVFPTGNNPPTPAVSPVPANFANQTAVSAAFDEGPVRIFIRNSSFGIPSLLGGGANNGPVILSALAAAGAIAEWAAGFINVGGGGPGLPQVQVLAPTALGAAHAASPSGCLIDIEYGAAIDGR